MPRPVHFEIHATDPAVVQAFYESVFGWRFQQWGDVPYWLVSTGDGDAMSGTPSSRRSAASEHQTSPVIPAQPSGVSISVCGIRSDSASAGGSPLPR